MKTTRINRAVKAILRTGRLVGVRETEELASLTEQIFSDYVNSHGKAFAIKMLKAFYQESIRFSCGLKVEPQTPMWVKRNKKDNFPVILNPFRKSLRQGSTVQRRISLSYLRVFEAIQLPVVPNLDTVVKPGLGALGFETFKKSYSTFLATGNFPRSQRGAIKRILEKMNTSPREIGLQYSTKRGVKGPTCVTAGKQVLNISEELQKTLVSFVSWFGIKPSSLDETINVNREFFKDHDDLFTPKGGHPPIGSDLGRLAFIPDKGGKTRLVAIGNYWIQSALRPFHKLLYSMLKELNEDGTFDQTKQSKRVCQASLEGPVWSWDLTAATDRFPIVMQQCTLENLHKGIASGWDSILNQMSFEYKGSSYKYAVGQPMGLYSSWAVFTLTHHYLVQYCAWLEGFQSFNQYAILGDDVAIWERKVAMRYSELLSILDLEVSKLKSFVPESLSGPCVAEFAKRIFDKGEEISPLSPIQCIDSGNIYTLPEFLYWLEERSFPLEGITPSRLKEEFALPSKYFNELLCLLHITAIIKAKTLVEVINEIPVQFQSLTPELILKIRIGKVAEQALDMVLELDLTTWSNREDLEKVLDGPVPDRLYFLNIINTRINEVEELRSRMSEYIPFEYFQTFDVKQLVLPTSPPELSDLEYLPQIDFPTLMKGITDHEDKKVYRGRYIQLLLKHLSKR